MPKSIHIVGSGVNTSMVSTTEDDVLIGKIFIDNKGNEAIGRIPDRSFAPDGVSPQTRNLDAGQTLDFDYGYYNHQFSIEANSLASQTVADAVASHILVNKTAWVNGNKIVGTMPDRAAVNSALNCGGSYTIPAGYHNGSGKITANSLASQTSATAQASHILVNKTAWVNGSKVTGIMTDRAAVTSALNCGGSYTIPAGYHNGSGKITANSLASQTSATAVAGDILSGKTAWVNGNKITGSIVDRGAVNTTVNVGNTYTIPVGYHNGSGKVTAGGNIDNLKAENIKKGVTILGITGTWEGYVASTNDLYYNGTNPAGFYKYARNEPNWATKAPSFEASYIQCDSGANGIKCDKIYNLIGYSKLSFTFYIMNDPPGTGYLYLLLFRSYPNSIWGTDFKTTIGNSVLPKKGTTVTYSISLVNLQTTLQLGWFIVLHTPMNNYIQVKRIYLE